MIAAMESHYLHGYETDRLRRKYRRQENKPSGRKRRRSTSPRRSAKRTSRDHDKYHRSKRSKSPREVDSEGHLKFKIGDCIGGK